MGFSLEYQFLCNLLFSKVCKFWVFLSAIECVFHYGAGFHVSSVQQSLLNLSLIECNWMGFSLWCQFCMYLQFIRICEFWVTLSATEWFFISVPIFMYFQFSKFCEFPVTFRATEWVFHHSVYLQFSKVCKFWVLLNATEWVFHYGAGFHVSLVQQGLRNLSLIECNWMGSSLWCRFCMYSILPDQNRAVFIRIDGQQPPCCFYLDGCFPFLHPVVFVWTVFFCFCPLSFLFRLCF